MWYRKRTLYAKTNLELRSLAPAPGVIGVPLNRNGIDCSPDTEIILYSLVHPTNATCVATIPEAHEPANFCVPHRTKSRHKGRYRYRRSSAEARLPAGYCSHATYTIKQKMLGLAHQQTLVIRGTTAEDVCYGVSTDLQQLLLPYMKLETRVKSPSKD